MVLIVPGTGQVSKPRHQYQTAPIPVAGSRAVYRLGRAHRSLSFMSQHHNNDIPPELERYLALCKRVYERMQAEGRWPWPDSPNLPDVIDSSDNPHTS